MRERDRYERIMRSIDRESERVRRKRWGGAMKLIAKFNLASGKMSSTLKHSACKTSPKLKLLNPIV